MKRLWLILFLPTAIAYAQNPTPPASSGGSPNEVEQLRQEVHSLTDVVKTLQQQVKDQQAVIDKLNPASPPLPQNPEPSATPTANTIATSSPTPPQLIPTEDASVVASASPSSSSPPVNANGAATAGAFPTTDASVTTTPETISSTGAGASLTAPITNR